MSLKKRLDTDLAEAVKSQSEPARTVLRSLLSAVHNEEIAQGGELDEAALAALLGKQLKQREESVAAYQSRPELAAKEQAEAEIIKAYLPKQLSDEAVAKLVEEAVAQTKATSMADMGKVMGALKEKTAGQVDGGRLAELVKAKLS